VTVIGLGQFTAKLTRIDLDRLWMQRFSEKLPQLQGLHNAKVVVYGYTDNLPVGPPLQRAGIANNIDLSSRRADNVVAYLTSQGVNPNIISAKGFGDNAPGRLERHGAGPLAKPPHRDRIGRPRRLMPSRPETPEVPGGHQE
jgi:hypothetical protein